jgi:hypothetical protein
VRSGPGLRDARAGAQGSESALRHDLRLTNGTSGGVGALNVVFIDAVSVSGGRGVASRSCTV